MSVENYFVGVDVGTGSVRAALVHYTGKVVKVAIESIKTWHYQVDFYEQSSDNIWKSCVLCIKKVVEGINPSNVKGLGFDATCSLVALNEKLKPLTVSLSGDHERNIILWMDHRASKEAEKINSLQHPVLRYVGGKISLEMGIPKLLWLKNNLKEESWNKIGQVFDLPDFLTWKATECDSRSLCSLVCKLTYEAKADGSHSWNENFLQSIGLEDLLENKCYKIGSKVQIPGTPVGNGLAPSVANELGLLAGTPVGASLIDAHAGGLGMIGCQVANVSPDFSTRLSLICGSSTCHMVVSPFPIFAPGIWGPYYSAMVPNFWLNEGGQSATGLLLDHLIQSHPATAGILKKIGDMHIQQYLSELLMKRCEKEGLSSVSFLTKDLHIWPDFHGNRSPIADATLKGIISGVSLSVSEEDLALLYLAGVQALAYGTKHILDALIQSGYSNIQSVLICGGLSKNPLFVQTQADVLNMPVICPKEKDSMLIGSAILGACAANYFQDMETAITTMGGEGLVVTPQKAAVEYHNKKYKVFLSMLEDQFKYRDIMSAL